MAEGDEAAVRVLLLLVEELRRRALRLASGRAVHRRRVVDREHDRLRRAEPLRATSRTGRPSSASAGGVPAGTTAVTRTSGNL